MTANIFNIQKFSIHDGPGIRTVVFFKGCPLRCLWCSNPESQSVHTQILWSSDKCAGCRKCEHNCPSGSISFADGYFAYNNNTCTGGRTCITTCPAGALEYAGKQMSVEEITAEVRKDMDFYEESNGGVTLSGGEILVWHDFAAELLAVLQSEQIHTAIETSGYATESSFQKVAGHVNLLLFDMKHHDPLKHLRYTGVSNEMILRNMNWAAQKGIPIIARIPVIPEVNDSPEDAHEFCELLLSAGIHQVNLLPFHQFGQKKYETLHMEYQMKDTKALHPEDLEDYKQIFIKSGFDVKI